MCWAVIGTSSSIRCARAWSSTQASTGGRVTGRMRKVRRKRGCKHTPVIVPWEKIRRSDRQLTGNCFAPSSIRAWWIRFVRQQTATMPWAVPAFRKRWAEPWGAASFAGDPVDQRNSRTPPQWRCSILTDSKLWSVSYYLPIILLPYQILPAERVVFDFFTVNLLEHKGHDLLVRTVDLLRDAIRNIRRNHSFGIPAWVMLPDHLHCIIQLLRMTVTSRCAGGS